MDRLAGTIQKIVTIPAALQNCQNPVPEIKYPDWLHKRIKIKNDKFKQKKLGHFFKTADIEDLARKKLQQFPQNNPQMMSIKNEIKDEKPKKPSFDVEKCPAPQQDFGQWLTH